MRSIDDVIAQSHSRVDARQQYRSVVFQLAKKTLFHSHASNPIEMRKKRRIFELTLFLFIDRITCMREIGRAHV